MDCPIDKWVITPLADQVVIAMTVCLLRIQKRGMTRNMRTVMVMTMLMVVVVINLVLPQQLYLRFRCGGSGVRSGAGSGMGRH